MRKQKLKLQMDELSVTSFDLEPGAMSVEGTVKAHDAMPPTTEPCYSWNTYCTGCHWTDCC